MSEDGRPLESPGEKLPKNPNTKASDSPGKEPLENTKAKPPEKAGEKGRVNRREKPPENLEDKPAENRRARVSENLKDKPQSTSRKKLPQSSWEPKDEVLFTYLDSSIRQELLDTLSCSLMSTISERVMTESESPRTMGQILKEPVKQVKRVATAVKPAPSEPSNGSEAAKQSATPDRKEGPVSSEPQDRKSNRPTVKVQNAPKGKNKENKAIPKAPEDSKEMRKTIIEPISPLTPTSAGSKMDRSSKSSVKPGKFFECLPGRNRNCCVQ